MLFQSGCSLIISNVVQKMKKIFFFIGLIGLTLPTGAQSVLSLDSCRALAIVNNKALLINREKITVAHYQQKAAFTNYLPNFSAAGGYLRNQREISLLNQSQKSTFSSMGTQVSEVMQTGIQNLLAQNPLLGDDQTFMTLVQSLTDADIATPLNGVGNSIVDAFRTDTRNMYAGALVLMQPLYMGGKIRAYDKITRYSEQLARQQENAGLQEVILNTDQAYWQVVSLAGKKKLAEGYLQLLQKLESDIDKMIAEGVATQADGLSVKVKVNEAEITLTKVEDGLSLSKMLLCQLCGLDLSTPILLEDEGKEQLIPTTLIDNRINLNEVYANRPEINSLDLATQIYRQKENVTRAEFLPSVALIGSYMATNPSLFNGYEKKFKGMWNVGITLSLPIWHWGEGFYKVKAAKAETRIAQYELNEAKEKIELQVNQSLFQVNEAAKRAAMAENNLEKANENLRAATLGFEEGVIPASNVLEAHTAWLSAQSERIDAQIDVKLTEIYFKKATGQLTAE